MRALCCLSVICVMGLIAAPAQAKNRHNDGGVSIQKSGFGEYERAWLMHSTDAP